MAICVTGLLYHPVASDPVPEAEAEDKETMAQVTQEPFRFYTYLEATRSLLRLKQLVVTESVATCHNQVKKSSPSVLHTSISNDWLSLICRITHEGSRVT